MLRRMTKQEGEEMGQPSMAVPYERQLRRSTPSLQRGLQVLVHTRRHNCARRITNEELSSSTVPSNGTHARRHGFTKLPDPNGRNHPVARRHAPAYLWYACVYGRKRRLVVVVMAAKGRHIGPVKSYMAGRAPRGTVPLSPPVPNGHSRPVAGRRASAYPVVR